jgi:hypothetical protein
MLTVPAIALMLATVAAATAGASWLDAATPPNWNTGELRMPQQSRATDPDIAPGGRCVATVRPPTAPEDRAVLARGWILFGPYERFGPLVVLTAATSVDGMCRPNGFQGFVFVGGVYAGTIAPKTMDSRTDGALSGLGIALFSAHDFNASFARYGPDDALCCPHATTYVSYEVRTAGGIMRVVPVSSYTQKTSS